jgi:XisI protein
LIFDEKRDRYLAVHVGWEDQERVYDCVVHVDIKDGKFGFNAISPK